ncbi:MAG: hemerythrin family protein [Gammaproteobacteria bacterium]|nr:hemerythrin family protein [Gammaproteobacteria bacterium]
MSLTSLNPENIYLVDLNFMNQTHFEEVEMVNALMEQVNARLSGEQNNILISQQLAQWLQHTQAHFARENQLMQETDFPAFSIHSDEHNIALNRMQTVIDAWEQNQDIELLKDYVFTLWPNWFKAHISTMDKMTAEFAVSNGYKEAS